MRVVQVYLNKTLRQAYGITEAELNRARVNECTFRVK